MTDVIPAKAGIPPKPKGVVAWIPAVAGMALAVAFAQAPDDDPFRYLEDARDSRTQAFHREQEDLARISLEQIPGRADLLARIRTLSAGTTLVTDVAMGGPRFFYLKRSRGMATQLWVREGIAAPERLLLDTSPVATGRAMVIDWIAPSPDGRHVAMVMSAPGEGPVLRMVVADGARILPFEIDRMRLKGGLAWHPDGKSFYYSRAPHDAEGPRAGANTRIYRHVLGRDPQHDEVVFAPGVGGARDVHAYAYPVLHVPHESRFAYAIAHDGMRREIAVHVTPQRDLAAARPRWQKLIGHEDEVLAVEGWRDDLYVLTRRGAPRHRVLRVKASAANMAAARPVVPQGDAVIEAMGLARDGLYLRTMVGGVDRLERVPMGWLGARAPEFLRIPFDTAIAQLVTDPRVAGALLRLQGWIEPPLVAQVEAKGGDLHRTTIQPPPAADFSAMDEVRLYAPAPDGTKVPVTLIYPKATRLTADNPVLLEAYGSYGVTMSPVYDPARLAWLERGGVVAVAHVRGGGEYGHAWHEQGRGAAKLNTVRDFIAAAEFLIAYGFTTPRRLAITGNGAGAIPVAGAMVRRPELFAAAIVTDPLLDMVSYGRGVDGPASAAEFGTASSAQGVEALRAISPYHQVRDAVAYPGMLLFYDRGSPWHAAKMAARLQKASASGRPVLLKAASASHEERLANVYSFALWQMGEPQFIHPPEAVPLLTPMPEPPSEVPAPAATPPAVTPPGVTPPVDTRPPEPAAVPTPSPTPVPERK